MTPILIIGSNNEFHPEIACLIKSLTAASVHPWCYDLEGERKIHERTGIIIIASLSYSDTKEEKAGQFL